MSNFYSFSDVSRINSQNEHLKLVLMLNRSIAYIILNSRDSFFFSDELLLIATLPYPDIPQNENQLYGQYTCPICKVRV
jgi:hypothetical protein